ncbi:PH domain-containing protein [Mycolicibacterium pyrenivorans]|uniref:PH domain-containing protein n=1 Tax=Mycolicibacterium pyrenivorans TaxID=187102 RepID=UPI0021F2D330|nr:PH domain-containing protein [Mycolicibacterium pyrenivorans]MCV7152902.1 PH domain-containing protein [Mycolicibacterium pyrenivorans]
MTQAAAQDWHRLSPRMLLVHPVHEVLRQIPVLIGSLVLGSATGNPVWTLIGIGLIVGYGLARWFTTTYRIGSDDVQLRTGVLQRNVLSVPRNRIRSVSTDARVLHRLLGLTVVQVSTGREAAGDTLFALDAVPAREVPGLRAVLLADSLAPAGGDAERAAAPGRVLARWQPSWLRYSPLTFTGLLMIAAAVGVVYQTGVVAALQDSGLARVGAGALEGVGLLGGVVIGALVVLAASVTLSVLQSLLAYANLELRRDAELLHLSHGLLRVREHTFDMRRLRGGTLREPLLVRLFGGARLDAVMTGVAGAGEASQLLPPCPRRTAEAVLADLIGRQDAVTGVLTTHGPAAVRRRWTRAMALPAAVAAATAITAATAGVAVWVWPALVLLTVGSVFLAVDRCRSLGHRVGDGWLVARAGSLARRRDCVAAAGIVGWTVRQTLLQRRAGVATLIAATAAGVKRYEVVDVPADIAWSLAATTSPWVAQSSWSRG